MHTLPVRLGHADRVRRHAPRDDGDVSPSRARPDPREPRGGNLRTRPREDRAPSRRVRTARYRCPRWPPAQPRGRLRRFARPRLRRDVSRTFSRRARRVARRRERARLSARSGRRVVGVFGLGSARACAMALGVRKGRSGGRGTVGEARDARARAKPVRCAPRAMSAASGASPVGMTSTPARRRASTTSGRAKVSGLPKARKRTTRQGRRRRRRRARRRRVGRRVAKSTRGHRRAAGIRRRAQVVAVPQDGRHRRARLSAGGIRARGDDQRAASRTRKPPRDRRARARACADAIGSGPVARRPPPFRPVRCHVADARAVLA